MKRFYLTTLAIMVTVLAFSQNTLPKVKMVNTSYYQVIESTKHKANLSKSAVVVQDFEEDAFPPTGWDTICGAQSLGNQHWYRQRGGRPDNGGYFAVIQRTASSSDATTRPQDEWLISPSFSVPGNAVLKFQFHSNYYWTVEPNNNANFNVKISTDDGNNWTNIWNEDDEYHAVAWPFSEWTDVTIDLSEYAGQENTKIAFQYVGEASCWFALDNIYVDVNPATDFALTDARVKFNCQYIDYGYNGFFSKYPRREISDNANNKFEGVVSNYGGEDVTVRMTAKVYKPSDDANPIFTYSFPDRTIPAATKDNIGVYRTTLDTISYWTAEYGTDTTYSVIPESIFMMNEMTENGTYTYEISVELVGSTYANTYSRNISSRFNTEITDECLYARDNNTQTTTYDANDPDWNNFTMFGTTYQLFNPEDVLQTAEAYIVEAEEGAQFHYEFFVRAENTYTSLIRTDTYTVGADFQPGFIRLSSEDMYPLYELEEGQYIEVVAAIVMENTKALSLGVDGTVKATEYECRAMDGTQWYIITGTNASLMIRVILCEDTPVETFSANEIEMYPNPTSGIVNFNNVENATIEVFNMMGQIVSRVENANENTTIDLSAVANGNYVVRIVKNGEVATSKLNIAR